MNNEYHSVKSQEINSTFQIRSRLRFITYSGIFTSLVIGLGFALTPIPNVEAVTMTIFLAGACLGPLGGIITGGLGEFLFSAINPMGSGFAVPFLLVAQTLSMIFVGTMGGLIGKRLFRLRGMTRMIISGITGILLTLIYNLLTSLSFPLMMGFNWKETIAYLISGIVFSVIQLVSNTLIFMFILPSTYDAILRFIPYFRERNAI